MSDLQYVGFTAPFPGLALAFLLIPVLFCFCFDFSVLFCLLCFCAVF